jgi:predicted nuclease with RNAse H fold
MIKKGYRVFPPNLFDGKAYLASNRLNSLIEENAYKTVDVHPTSTLKALRMPLKDRNSTGEILKRLGLRGELGTRPLVNHEIYAVAAALTVVLHLKNQTEAIGDEEAGCIIVPKRRDWRPIAT